MSIIKQRRGQLAQLIRARLDALNGRKSPADIARELGFTSDRAICLYAAGETFVPLDRAIPLAQALELDPGAFFRAALECFMQLPEGLEITFQPTTEVAAMESRREEPGRQRSAHSESDRPDQASEGLKR